MRREKYALSSNRKSYNILNDGEPWEQWFEPEEIIKLLQKYGVKAYYKMIAYGNHSRPDGLFIAWKGVKPD